MLIWSDRSAETGRSTVGKMLELVDDLGQKARGQLWMYALAAAHADGNFHLVAGLEELLHRSDFEVHVVIACERSKADFLDLTGFLVLSVFPVFPVLLVLEFPVVEDLGYGAAAELGKSPQGPAPVRAPFSKPGLSAPFPSRRSDRRSDGLAEYGSSRLLEVPDYP